MKKKVTIVGGGACAIFLACELDPSKFEVDIYEKNSAPGRKFLVAGDGGLNLTHSENPSAFVQNYTPVAFLEKAFGRFNNHDFVAWLNGKGIQTFTGSSGRVFPTQGMKPITVLNTLLGEISRKGMRMHTKCEWKGFTPAADLLFDMRGESVCVAADIVVFCLGGASWPVTGSTGTWRGYFSSSEILVNDFEASNCAFKIDWPAGLMPGIAGKALKNCSITCGKKTQHGEVVLTSFGAEGSGIYPLSPYIRAALTENGRALITIDLKPAVRYATILERIRKAALTKSYSESLTTLLNLNSLQRNLLKALVSKDDFLDPEKLAACIKKLPLYISALGPVDEAISTVGGIDLSQVNENFELKKMPGKFVIGEMLDYDAPTGGYLLQSCFTMSAGLAAHLNQNA